MSHHVTHTGGSLGARRIDARDAPSTYGRTDDAAVEGLSCFPLLVRVRGLAGYLQRAVDAIDGMSDHDALLTCAACASVRQSVRLASSILKSFSPYPIAPASAASAASRNVLIDASWPISATSASNERHGLCATPPKAILAAVINSFSVATITATDTSANAYDARSRTLR